MSMVCLIASAQSGNAPASAPHPVQCTHAIGTVAFDRAAFAFAGSSGASIGAWEEAVRASGCFVIVEPSLSRESLANRSLAASNIIVRTRMLGQFALVLPDFIISTANNGRDGAPSAVMTDTASGASASVSMAEPGSVGLVVGELVRTICL